ncbi:hypothetical protein [Cytophaga sp. FL35]|uniref:hypothetical protein n=1 Tax=Cytophaga sp. FL35 TaxID=1904456 RepID=UPI001653AE5A|nr:hypothetical protein [Cytophaga sp. FL35]MBC6999677.1 hypothetical protein [Cytophaga sp. FL35]
MDIYDSIDDFFEIISDPRNVSPIHFNIFFPSKFKNRQGSKSLDDSFELIQKFKRYDGHNHKDLESRVFSILQKIDRFSEIEANDALEYYAVKSRNADSFKTGYMITDGILSEKERYHLFASYHLFFGHIKIMVGKEIKNLVENKDKLSNNREFPEMFKSLDAFNVFRYYTANYIGPNVKKDHSYLYHMLFEKELLRFKPSKKNYLNWLVSDNYITESDVDNFYNEDDKNPLYSLSKCKSETRLDSFIKSLEKYFPTN